MTDNVCVPREPTKEMYLAADDTLLGMACETWEQRQACYKATWEAMIDEALG
jgi:hypothetical protein